MFIEGVYGFPGNNGVELGGGEGHGWLILCGGGEKGCGGAMRGGCGVGEYVNKRKVAAISTLSISTGLTSPGKGSLSVRVSYGCLQV
jgi:hypothetical protein